MNLTILSNSLAIAQLPRESSIPEWALQSEFISITKTTEELSIVCDEDMIPEEIKTDRNWQALKVQGPLDFTLTGILSSLVEPLAKANISIFAISTFDTDYILVKKNDLANAVKVLTDNGHSVESDNDMEIKKGS